jgi:hypothetical protein
MISVVSKGYSFWDSTDNQTGQTVTIGTWDFFKLLSLQVPIDMTSYLDNEIANDPNTDLLSIYTQTNIPNNQYLTIPGIEMYGYDWDITGKGKTGTYPTIGYISLIDRSLDINNDPLHAINTIYTTNPTFPEYNYFVSNDANNLYTNNLYSIRLNYNSRMQSAVAISNITNISFYAAVGLSDPNDALALRDGQNVIVEVSTDGNSWSRIGRDAPSLVTQSDEYFDFYSYDIPTNMLNQDLYVLIRFNGRARNVAGIDSFSRLIIDELEITTN